MVDESPHGSVPTQTTLPSDDSTSNVPPADVETAHDGTNESAPPTMEVRRADANIAQQSPNLNIAPEFVYCDGTGGWVVYSIPSQRSEHAHAQLRIRYVSADPRPLRVRVDDVVVGAICELSTVTWDTSDDEWSVSMPFPFDWSHTHELRLETEAFFPHIIEYALVPCASASIEMRRAHLARLLEEAVVDSKRDIDKATCLVATLDEALFGRTKGHRTLQKATLEALTSTLTAIEHKHTALCNVAARRLEE
jgi:hypothetical protein